MVSKFFVSWLKLCCRIFTCSLLSALPSALGVGLELDRDDRAGDAPGPVQPNSFCMSVAACSRVTVNERVVHYGDPVLIC